MSNLALQFIAYEFKPIIVAFKWCQTLRGPVFWQSPQIQPQIQLQIERSLCVIGGRNGGLFDVKLQC